MRLGDSITQEDKKKMPCRTTTRAGHLRTSKKTGRTSTVRTHPMRVGVWEVQNKEGTMAYPVLGTKAEAIKEGKEQYGKIGKIVWGGKELTKSQRYAIMYGGKTIQRR